MQAGRIAIEHGFDPDRGLPARLCELRAALLVAGSEPSARLRELLFAVGDVSVVWAGGLRELELSGLRATRPDLVVADVESLAIDIPGLAVAISAVWQAPAIAVLPKGATRSEPAGRSASLTWVDPCSSTLADLRESMATVRRRIAGVDASRLPGAGAPVEGKREGLFAGWLLGGSTERGVHQAPAREVIWIEALHNHVRVHTLRGSFILRRGIAEVAKTLAPDLFARIHRSTIVNLGAVVGVRSDRAGALAVTLANGTSLSVGRLYGEHLCSVLNARQSESVRSSGKSND